MNRIYTKYKKPFIQQASCLLVCVLLLLPSLFLKAQTFYGYQGPSIISNTQLTSNNSYCINPNQFNYELVDSILNVSPNSHLQFKYQDFTLSATPFTYISNVNSTIASGINLGTLIPNRGNQQLVSLGARLNWKDKISIQLAPEFQTADNKVFAQYPLNSTDWDQHYYYLNHIDLPEQQGNLPLKKWYPGQSYIKYHFTNFDASLSTENKWWGPANFNPLVLSSNAQGFYHASFATNKPFVTRIGSFEGEIISGVLENSGFYPPETNRISVRLDQTLYEPKKQNSRYITGLIYTYQPKWVPGLYLGLTKLSMLYKDELSNGLDLLPLEGFFGNKLTPTEASGRKASMGSWFLRYTMPSEHAEFYYEYGRNDQSLHLGNIFQQKPYGRAFTAGLKKAFELKPNYGFLQLGLEITTLSLPQASQVYSTPSSWYLDNYVRQGFTNKGKVLGAGIGPGSNSQTLFLQWMKGMNNVGVRVNRVIHNLDFYHSTHYYLTDHFNQYWATVSTTAYFSVSIKKMTLAGEYTWQRDLNYQWEWYRYTDIGFNNVGNDLFNHNGRLMLSYRL